MKPQTCIPIHRCQQYHPRSRQRVHAPGPTELVPRTEAARAQLPLLAPREELILEERMALARIRAEHEPQPEQVAVDPAPGRRLARQLRVRLQRALEECEARVGL